MADINRAAFTSWADMLGIKGSAEHLDQLRGEVQSILVRLESLDSIDVSEVSPEEAGLRHDDGAQ